MLKSGLRVMTRAQKRLAQSSSKPRQSFLYSTVKSTHRVAVIGGYGNFGTRLCNLLASSNQERIINSATNKEAAKIEIIILGRDKNKAADLQAQLRATYPDVAYETAAVDYKNEEIFKAFLKEHRVDTLIHTSGPFDNQTQRQYSVARSCIQNGTHYIDLADDREFVSGIYSLDEQAKKSNVAVIAGASTVPGISSAVVEHLAKNFSEIEAIECSLNAGSATIPKGKATIESLLLYCGKPFKVLQNGEWKTTYGYLNTKLQTYLGLHTSRLVSDFNVPDLTLLPQKYPSLKTMEFKAGVELKTQQLGMTWMGWLTKKKIFSAWSKLGNIAFEPLRRLFGLFGGEEGKLYFRFFEALSTEIELACPSDPHPTTLEIVRTIVRK